MKAKHLTILQWSKMVHKVAEKYLQGDEYVHASIEWGIMSHWSEPRIWYRVCTNSSHIGTDFFQEDWKMAFDEFKHKAIEYHQNKISSPVL